MSGRIWIEQLTRRGVVAVRQPFDALPVRIGRSYRNDLLLEDRGVAPEHLVIERDGTSNLVVRAVNGEPFRIGREKQPRAESALDGDTIIRIGGMRLRVRRADHAVAPARHAVPFRAGGSGMPLASAAAALLLAYLVMVVGA